MKRAIKQTIELQIRVPPIELGSWTPNTRALEFAYQHEDITGNIFIHLDEDQIEWDYTSYTDPETGESEGVKQPLSCSRIIIRVEGLYDNKPAINMSLSTLEKLPFLSEPTYSPAELNFLTVAHDLTIEYMSNFVDYINFELGQYWVNLGRMSEWGMWYFYRETNAKWIETDSGHKDSVVAGASQIIAAIDEGPTLPAFYSKSKGLDEVYWKKMRDSLKETQRRGLANRLILNAKRYLANGDYRTATIESIDALEVRLPSFAKRRRKEKGIPKTNGAGITNLLNLLPSILEKDEFEQWLSQRVSAQPKHNTRIRYHRTIPEMSRSQQSTKPCCS